MNSNLERTVAELLALPPHERAFLAETLIESLDFRPEFEVSQEWLDEIRTRCRQIDTGDSGLLSSAEVLDQLRKQVG